MNTSTAAEFEIAVPDFNLQKYNPALSPDAQVHAPGKYTKWLQATVKFLLAYCLLNLPFWIYGISHFQNRAAFNLDLLLPLVLLPRSRVLGYLTLAIFWGIDALIGLSKIFYFLSPLDFLQSFRFAGNLSWSNYFTLFNVALLLAVLVLLRFIPPLICKDARRFVIAGSIFTGLAAMAVAGGTTFITSLAILPIGHVAGTPTLSLINVVTKHQDLTVHSLAANSSVFPHAKILAWAKAHPDRSVVYIVVESLGIHNDNRMQQYITAPFKTNFMAKHYSLTEERVPFKGRTTDGELREMCNITGSTLAINATNGASCLPHQLDEINWISTGLHGFTGDMFLRAQWWPDIGLQHTMFEEEFARSTDDRCGLAFLGICDANLIGKAFEIATKPQNFVYALTLNSHLPIGTGEVPSDLAQLCAATDNDPQTCYLSSKLRIVTNSILSSLQAADPAHLPLVMIVGDHAPPFSENSIRRHYSQIDVPGFVLIPKETVL